MSKINYNKLNFLRPYVEKRNIKDNFFCKINKIVDWNKISNLLEKYYNKGTSVTGRKSYPALLLFKINLLQTWYGLSDYEVESQVSDRLSFMNFCDLCFDDTVPDHSVISRFRKVLVEKEVYEKLLEEINEQLSKHSLLVKGGVIIDASITETNRKPKGKKRVQVTQEPSSLQPITKQGVDTEGSWTKKGGQLKYGYKKHYVCDKTTSIVLGVSTSQAHCHDSKYMEPCLDKVKISKGSEVYADKGYAGQPNEKMLSSKGLKSRIQNKGLRGKTISKWAKKRNILISKTRYKVERIFGGIKRWFKSGYCRYVGKLKTHGQHVLEAIAYNIKISPGLLIKRSFKG